MENKYLANVVGLPLRDCIAELTMTQPRDPIEWMAHWLYRYSDNQIYYYEKSKFIKNLYTMHLDIQQAKERQQTRLNNLSGQIKDANFDIYNAANKIAKLKKETSSMRQKNLPGFLEFYAKKFEQGFTKKRPDKSHKKVKAKVHVRFSSVGGIRPGLDTTPLYAINRKLSYVGRLAEGQDLLSRYSMSSLAQGRLRSSSKHHEHNLEPKMSVEWGYKGQGPLDEFGIGFSKTRHRSHRHKLGEYYFDNQDPEVDSLSRRSFSPNSEFIRKEVDKYGNAISPSNRVSQRTHSHIDDSDTSIYSPTKRRHRHKSRMRYDDSESSRSPFKRSSEGDGSHHRLHRKKSDQEEDHYQESVDDARSRRSHTESESDGFRLSRLNLDPEDLEFMESHCLVGLIDSDTDVKALRNDPEKLARMLLLKATMGKATWTMDCNLSLVCNHTVLGIMRGRKPFVPPETPEWWEKKCYVLQSLYDHEIYSCDDIDVIHFYNYVPHLTYQDFHTQRPSYEFKGDKIEARFLPSTSDRATTEERSSKDPRKSKRADRSSSKYDRGSSKNDRVSSKSDRVSSKDDRGSSKNDRKDTSSSSTKVKK